MPASRAGTDPWTRSGAGSSCSAAPCRWRGDSWPRRSGPSTGSDARTIELWLAAYAVIFGATMLNLSLRLQRRHGEAAAATNTGP